MENALWLLTAHYIGDYPLQSDFLAQTKGTNYYSLFVHSFIYSMVLMACFKFLGVFALWKVFILLISHIVIDYKKTNAKNKDKALTTYLYIDQSIHILINFILYLL